MNTYAYDELFHETGPDEAIDYLWGRLQDRDLTQEEALALLSAVHRQLARARGSEPRAYFAYTRFMESLSREMPVVHDYVVAHWIQSRRALRRESKQGDESQPAAADEDGQASRQSPVDILAAQSEGFAPSPVA